MKVLKEKILLLAKVGCVLIALATIIIACKDEDYKAPKPPKWELPQPIDALLLGSWEPIEGNMAYLFDNCVVTFYEDNKYVTKTAFVTANGKNVERETENRWSVNGDTLVFPDAFDGRTGRFTDYTYNLSDDGKLLYLKGANYPWLPLPFGWYHTAIGIHPAGINDGIYKRLEEVE